MIQDHIRQRWMTSVFALSYQKVHLHLMTFTKVWSVCFLLVHFFIFPKCKVQTLDLIQMKIPSISRGSIIHSSLVSLIWFIILLIHRYRSFKKCPNKMNAISYVQNDFCDQWLYKRVHDSGKGLLRSGIYRWKLICLHTFNSFSRKETTSWVWNSNVGFVCH